MQRLVTLEPVPHLPVMPTVHRTMGRLRKGSIGMPKAKKSKVVRFEDALNRDPPPVGRRNANLTSIPRDCSRGHRRGQGGSNPSRSRCNELAHGHRCLPPPCASPLTPFACIPTHHVRADLQLHWGTSNDLPKPSVSMQGVKIE